MHSWNPIQRQVLTDILSLILRSRGGRTIDNTVRTGLIVAFLYHRHRDRDRQGLREALRHRDRDRPGLHEALRHRDRDRQCLRGGHRHNHRHRHGLRQANRQRQRHRYPGAGPRPAALARALGPGRRATDETALLTRPSNQSQIFCQIRQDLRLMRCGVPVVNAGYSLMYHFTHAP